jgi:anti-anti-sigma regulatory factor
MRCDPAEPDEGSGDPPRGEGDAIGAAEPDEHAVCVRPVAAGVVVVAVRRPLTGKRALVLRDAALAELGHNPRMVLVTFATLADAEDGVAVLDTAGVAALIEVAHEAGDADIGLCLVVPQACGAAVATALNRAGARELFDICPTIAAALDTAP